MRIQKQYLTGYSRGTGAEKKATTAKLTTVCAWCGMARNEDGSWRELDKAEKLFDGLMLTHCICLECLWKLSPEIYAGILEE